MPTETAAPLRDLEDAEAAYKRVEPEAMALSENQFTALNVDPIVATSIILGVADRILAYRERIARLPEFDLESLDGLVDRAKACWFAVTTNLPQPEPKDFPLLFDECAALRTKMLTWAAPLVHARHFEQLAIDKIKEGSGNKDVPSDVVALVALYRSKWDDIKTICGVTEADLERGALIAPSVFATVSRRENKGAPSLSDGSLKVRRFWTLADRSYDQCQRAIAYLEWGVVDIASIAPSLRRNAGTRPTPNPTPEPPSPPAPVPNAAASSPVVPVGPTVGNGSGPFAR